MHYTLHEYKHTTIITLGASHYIMLMQWSQILIRILATDATANRFMWEQLTDVHHHTQ